jgi:ubiquinone/menaquinone biosynthesis C-methylase UbiE
MSSSSTQTGTGAIEGRMWSVRADDWAAIQERVAPTCQSALDALSVGPDTRLLDVGCGAGMFLRLAADQGAEVDQSIHVVTGCNSFQYAARPTVALGEARRVAVPRRGASCC